MCVRGGKEKEMPGPWSYHIKQQQNFREQLAGVSRICMDKKVLQCEDQFKESI